MRNQFEQIITGRNLEIREYNNLFQKLKVLKTFTGIESICFEKEELFVEYNPSLINIEKIYHELAKIGFPLLPNAIPAAS